MSNILKHAKKSSLMDISIMVGGKMLEFNLYQELKINPADINYEVTRQAQLYGFLGLVYSRAMADLERAENNKEFIYERLYVKFKSEKNPTTGRANSDDLCKSKAIANPKFQLALKKYRKIKNDANIIKQVLESFKQRKDLIQTYSSNNRNNS